MNDIISVTSSSPATSQTAFITSESLPTPEGSIITRSGSYCAITWFNALQPITSTFFTSIGKSIKGVFLSMTRQILFLLPLVLILPKFMGVEGVLYAGPIADFSAGICGMVGGQVLDINSEERTLTEQEVLDIQSRKTGALIRAACAMGAIAGGASEEQYDAAKDREYKEYLAQLQQQQKQAEDARIQAHIDYTNSLLRRAQDINMKGVENLADAAKKNVDVTCTMADAKAFVTVYSVNEISYQPKK